MRDPNYIHCLRRLLALGYDLRTAKRIAAWAVNPNAPLYPEGKQ